MVKLVRLSTENDCKFNANLDSDLVVGNDAQIAVQNLTFESVFNVLNISANDRTIKFNLDRDEYIPDTSRTDGFLQTQIYTSDNYTTFFPALEVALNDTLTLNKGAAHPHGKYKTTGQFDVGPSNVNNERQNITFRLSPVVHPQALGPNGRDFNPVAPNSDAGNIEPYKLYDDLFMISKTAPGGVAEETLSPIQGTDGSQILAYGGYKKKVGVASSALLDSFIYPTSADVNWCKGSSVYYCRVGSLPIAGNKEEEGFAIGLSQTPIVGSTDDGTPLKNTDRTFEIRAYRKGDFYEFVTNNNATTSTLTPASAETSLDDVPENDVLMLEKTGTQIIGSVTQTFAHWDLTTGNNWTQAPGGAIEIFDTTNLGTIATYRRTQVAAPTNFQWYVATGQNTWDVYNSGSTGGTPPNPAVDTRDAVATSDNTSGVISVAGVTFNPAQQPTRVAQAAFKNILFTTELTYLERANDLYPYMYICGSEDEGGGDQNGSVVQWVGMTLDPFDVTSGLQDDADDFNAYDDLLYPQGGNAWGAAGQATGDNPVRTSMDNSDPTIVAKLPTLDEELYFDNWATFPELSPILSIPKEILRFMGFSEPQFNGAGYFDFTRGSFSLKDNFGFTLIPSSDFQVANDENYVVVIDSHPVVSYDCSLTQGKLLNSDTASKTGKRMNIIATIPQQVDVRGVVNFEANNLIYIDLDNNFKQNISNIRVRVLTKQLEPITTRGSSIITLLIKDASKE
tara:strand:+ start:101 stop:2305 length:2205 start_codon:yes stop_codon:yes gene_type:complete